MVCRAVVVCEAQVVYPEGKVVDVRYKCGGGGGGGNVLYLVTTVSLPRSWITYWWMFVDVLCNFSTCPVAALAGGLQLWLKGMNG